jgi:hypothetical protein
MSRTSIARGGLVQTIERITQHVAGTGLQRLQRLALVLVDGAVDVAHELRELALGGSIAFLIHMDRSQRQARFDMGRRLADGVAETACCFIEVTQPARNQAEIVEQHRLPRVLRHGLAPQAFCFLQGTALRQADRKIVKDVGPFAVPTQGVAKQRLGAIEPACAQELQSGLQIGVGLRLGVGPRRGSDGHGWLCRPASRARLHENPHGQSYGQRRRPFRRGDGRREAARQEAADREPCYACRSEAKGRGTCKAQGKVSPCSVA